jgi:hypothetical protein
LVLKAEENVEASIDVWFFFLVFLIASGRIATSAMVDGANL